MRYLIIFLNPILPQTTLVHNHPLYFNLNVLMSLIYYLLQLIIHLDHKHLTNNPHICFLILPYYHFIPLYIHPNHPI